MSIQKYKVKLERGQLLTLSELSNLAETAISILAQQSTLIERSGEHFVIGDIHGQFHDFLHMMHSVIPQQSQPNLIFLGDYVDRGYHSIETICYLLCVKCILPNQTVILRGNHQTSSLTRIYGFYDEVIKKYGNPSPWKKIIEVFSYLPLAAAVNNKVLCVHGGLSPLAPTLDEICEVDRVKQSFQTGIICDLVWSDPQNGDRQGWHINNRGAGYIFSKEIVKEFLHINGLETIARAHQLVEEGYIYNFGDQSFVTVWSAPNYCYRCGNEASVMKISENGDKSFIKFGPSIDTAANKIHYEHVLPYFL